MTKHLLSWSAALTLLLLSGGVCSQSVYKSVDESGNVIFSDTPPERAVITQSVEVPPGPSEESIEQAREEVEEISKRADELEERRLQKEQARRADERERQQQTRTEPPAQSGEDDASPYWYPAYPGYPTYPGRPHRPYPPQHSGGDHPAYTPWRPGPRPPGHPVPLPEGGRVLGPARP
jgi:TolA-binding protein